MNPGRQRMAWHPPLAPNTALSGRRIGGDRTSASTGRLLYQVDYHHTVLILIPYCRNPEGALGMSAYHCIASTVQFFTRYENCESGLLAQANIARIAHLKAAKSSNFWPSCPDIAGLGDGSRETVTAVGRVAAVRNATAEGVRWQTGVRRQ